MRRFVTRLACALALCLLPSLAAAQTSAIAGEVKDTSGAVLPGVTVEVASPALIEKVRSATTDGSGRYSIPALRPGVYSVTFSLPGFNTIKREGVELTSDFTASINAEMKVGGVEETITVAAESPVVDVQNITQRVVMTRDVLDAVPTGRNIQAVGIMIPGTTIAQGGGGALSRDVGGSGGMQQSPLQFRGSGDTVQTIEGLRLNNLCAQGAYSGVYWNDGSFQDCPTSPAPTRPRWARAACASTWCRATAATCSRARLPATTRPRAGRPTTSATTSMATGRTTRTTA